MVNESMELIFHVCSYCQYLLLIIISKYFYYEN